MTTKRSLYGAELRYVLTFYLSQHGRATVPELIEVLDYYGFDVSGRASKSVSDALRWEIAHGRVRRLRRGLYGQARSLVLLRTESESACLRCGQRLR